MLRLARMALRLDHVGIAVWDVRPAAHLWGTVLGGDYRQGAFDHAGFTYLQFAYSAGSRVEVLAPSTDRTGFLVRHLERHGEGVHHLTFVTDDLRAELARLRAAGERVFDEDYTNPHWQEAFLSPQLGGRRLLIQVGQSDLDPEAQDREFGRDALESVLRAAERLASDRESAG
jgi:methylmalonyl-CoA/ethylmalonyl-CoA epimerase